MRQYFKFWESPLGVTIYEAVLSFAEYYSRTSYDLKLDSRLKSYCVSPMGPPLLQSTIVKPPRQKKSRYT